MRRKMRRMYERPEMRGQVFAADEYIASCAENNTYYFKCNAGGGRYGGLYDLDWNRISNTSSSYHACGETHQAPTDDEFIRGYFDPDRNHNNGNELEVYIWLEGYRNWWGEWVTTNRHATTNLDMDSWKNQS